MKKIGILLLVPIIAFGVEINIPTANYCIDSGEVYIDGFGHTPGYSLPVRVFPIILPQTMEIGHIEVTGSPVPIPEFVPTVSRYAIQKFPVEFLGGKAEPTRNMGVILPPMKLGENMIYPIIIHPFFYTSADELVHTPVINISVDCFSLPSYSPSGSEGDRHLCILTVPSLEHSLESFISRKTALGYDVSLVTVPPSTSAREIRKLLKQKHDELGFSNLLIVGDHRCIPQFLRGDTKTDFYYGELTSDIEGRFEPFAEVAVGRIPYGTPERVEDFLLRSILFQLRENEENIFCSCSYDMVSPDFVREMDKLLSDYDVDYEDPHRDRYSINIQHTLDVELNAPPEDALIISTTAHSGNFLLEKYGDRVAGIIAPTSESYFIQGKPGGTSTLLYNILENFLLNDMSVGEAMRKGAIDYWMQYPDSFTEKNIASFHLFGDPTNTFKIIQNEDVGINEILHIPFRTEPGSTVSPVVVLRNFGNRTARNGKLTIEIEKENEIIYYETMDVSVIEPQEDRQVDFPEFIMGGGEVLVRVSSTFPMDFNPSNDIIEKKIVADFETPVVISTDTSYAGQFIQFLSGNAILSRDTSSRTELKNVFILTPFPVGGENIYVEGFAPDREYNGRFKGVGIFTEYSFAYNGSLSSVLPEWLSGDSLSYAMVDGDGNPVAFYSGSRFVFMGRALYLDQPSLFLGIIESEFCGKETAKRDTLSILFECNPNPTRGETAVLFEIPLDDMHITLSMYDLMGHLVKTLVDEQFSKGMYSYIFDGLDARGEKLVSGTYFVSLSIDGRVFSKKLVVIR